MKRQADGPDLNLPGPKGPRRDIQGRGPRGPPGPGGSGGPPGRPSSLLPEDPDIMMEVPVPVKHCKMLIGPGGENATRIRREARCQLHVRREVTAKGSDTQIVELRGTSDQCQAGLKAVQTMIETAEPGFQLVPGKIVFIHIDVAPEMVAPILGSKGATAKAIFAKTGGQIKIGDINPEHGLQVVSIIGPMEKIKAAYKEVRLIVSRFNPARVKGPPPQSRRGMNGGPPPPFMNGPPPPFMNGPPPAFRDEFGRRGPPQGRAPPMNMGPPHGRGPLGREAEPLLAPYRGPNPHGGPAGEAPPQFLVLQPDGTYKPGNAPMQGQGNPQAAVAGGAGNSLLAQLSSGFPGGLGSIPGIGNALLALLTQQQPQPGGAGQAGGLAALLAGAAGGPAGMPGADPSQQQYPQYGAQPQGQPQAYTNYAPGGGYQQQVPATAAPGTGAYYGAAPAAGNTLFNGAAAATGYSAPPAAGTTLYNSTATPAGAAAYTSAAPAASTGYGVAAYGSMAPAATGYNNYSGGTAQAPTYGTTAPSGNQGGQQQGQQGQAGVKPEQGASQAQSVYGRGYGY